MQSIKRKIERIIRKKVTLRNLGSNNTDMEKLVILSETADNNNHNNNFKK